MNKTLKKVVIGVAAVVAVVAIIAVIIIYRRYSPGKTKGDLNEFFGVSEGEVAIVMQDEVYAKKGKIQDGNIYLPVSFVKEFLNDKFYWDVNELELLYTTPTEVIEAVEGKSKYSVNGKSESYDKPVCMLFEDSESGETEGYVSIDFADTYSAFNYTAYQEPDRVVINYKFGIEESFAKTTKKTQVRHLAGVKSEILSEVKKGESVKILSTDDNDQGFDKVMTESGVIGYIKENHLGDSKKKEITTDYVEPEYSHILMDEKVSLGFHQIASTEGNSEINTILASNAEINVLCPTWFQSSDNNGAITSYGDYDYVAKAHEADIQVWGLCNDFSEDNQIGKVLSSTTSRQKLEKNLVAEAIKYDLDGLNIDFEYVRAENGSDFTQFIRELSILCRKYELVLSIDNYPNIGGTEYYNRAEQAKVADYVITMAYDEYYPGGDSTGPNSSLGYVKTSISTTLEEVPAEQTIIALPFYYRAWQTKGKKIIGNTAYGMNNTDSILATTTVKPVWDENLMLNYLSYKGDNNVKYEIWIEDETSLEYKMKEVKNANIAGMAYWKIGFETDGVWNLVKKYNK